MKTPACSCDEQRQNAKFGILLPKAEMQVFWCPFEAPNFGKSEFVKRMTWSHKWHEKKQMKLKLNMPKMNGIKKYFFFQIGPILSNILSM
jgi:hypothetical protein